MLTISVLTIEPALFESFLSSHVIKRAEELRVLKVNLIDIRDYAGGSFRHIDDSPYGGGNGMILRVAPVVAALEDAEKRVDEKAVRIALTPRGEKYTQKMAWSLSEESHLILVCGHYEGMDERIYSYVDREISVGDYILTGGELPAQVMMDSIARILPGVLKEGSAREESFENDLMEYPQYTKPREFQGKRVPDVLLSGNHEEIRAWRKSKSRVLKKTEIRSDQNPWEKISLDDYEKHMSLDSVYQLQKMNSIMKEQFNAYPVKTAMVLGIAGGNGLEHVDTAKYQKVYGVDINEAYLKAVANRYASMEGVLECLHLDIVTNTRMFPKAELVIANLLIEYIGYMAFQNVIKQTDPKYVSCVIQVNTDQEKWVSDSPYLHAFDGLDEIHHHVEEGVLTASINEIGYSKILSGSVDLPNGKRLIRLDYTKKFD